MLEAAARPDGMAQSLATLRCSRPRCTSQRAHHSAHITARTAQRAQHSAHSTVNQLESACLGTIVQMGGHRHSMVSRPQAVLERKIRIW